MLLLSSEHAQRTAIKIGTDAFSFAELHAKIQCTAKRLNTLPQSILMLTAKPKIEFIVQLLAAIQTNRPVALFADQQSEAERAHKVALLGNAITIDDQDKLAEQQCDKPDRHHPDLALILFTSGTTGQVKAVQLSQANINANCSAVIKALKLHEIDDQLLFLPLSYSFGLLGQLIPGLMSGATTHLITQFTEIKALLETGDVPQMWSGVPSHWVAITRMAALYPEHAATIKAVVSAGAPLPLNLRQQLRDHFPAATIYNNYGLTEASPRVLTYSSDDPLFMESYAGYPIGDWQVRLSEEDELLIQGKQIMLGYLGEAADTKIKDGWLTTGDIAEIHPSGLIAIKGRRDHQVNIGGEKVNLNEIEQTICQIPMIKELIVLPIPDDIYGTRLLACIEKNHELTALTEQKLTEIIRHHLLPRHVPISAQLVNHLPRNPNGKPDRKTLLAQTLDHKEQNNAN